MNALSPEQRDDFFGGYRSVTQADRYLEDELVSRILGTQGQPPQPAEEAARQLAAEIARDYDKKQSVDQVGQGSSVEDDDVTAPKYIPTNDDEEIRQKTNLVTPSSRPTQSNRPISPQIDPKSIDRVGQALSTYRDPAHEGGNYFNYLKNMMGGDANGHIADLLKFYKGDENQTIDNLLDDIEDDMKVKGQYAPRQQVAPQPEEIPAPQPVQPATSDEELTQLIEPYAKRNGSPKIISSLLNAKGVQVSPDKVKEILDRLNAERIASRQAPIPEEAPENDDDSVEPIEDLVSDYMKGGMTSVKEILRRLQDEHGIRATPEQVRSAVTDAKRALRTFDVNRGVDVSKKGQAEDDDIPDDEDDDEEGENEGGLSGEDRKAIEKFLIANSKKSPDKLARAIKKQMGVDVDEDTVQDMIADLYSQGRIKFEAVSFENWMSIKGLN